MTDSLKERLRAAALYGVPISHDTVREAAQAISTLEAERDRLREACAKMDSLASGPGTLTQPLRTFALIADIGERALNPTGVGEAG